MKLHKDVFVNCPKGLSNMAQYGSYTRVKGDVDDVMRQEIHSLIHEVAQESLEEAGENPSEFHVEITEEKIDEYTKFSWIMTKQ